MPSTTTFFSAPDGGKTTSLPDSSCAVAAIVDTRSAFRMIRISAKNEKPDIFLNHQIKPQPLRPSRPLGHWIRHLRKRNQVRFMAALMKNERVESPRRAGKRRTCDLFRLNGRTARLRRGFCPTWLPGCVIGLAVPAKGVDPAVRRGYLFGEGVQKTSSRPPGIQPADLKEVG